MRIQIIFEPEEDEEDPSSDTGLTEEAYLDYTRHFGSIESVRALKDDE